MKRAYDGDGLRASKSNGTLYWRSTTGATLAESDRNGNTTNEYAFFAGHRIARIDASGNAFYYFSDQLGTTRAMTDAQGRLCYDAEYTPYGEEISHTERLQTAACPQNYKFTGYERDPETGLDYAIARYYSSGLGRFMSPDPIAGDVHDPQTLNGYAYVRNNSNLWPERTLAKRL